MDLNVVSLVLVGTLLIGYAVLDGFDLGVGILHAFARDEQERRFGLNAIAPLWDGNEVWLLAGGGTLFAAFPKAYATIFSSLYLALVLLLVALIFRAVAIEFRGKVAAPAWRRVWDAALVAGSVAVAFLLGVAVGNLLRGLPLDAGFTFTGTFLGLLNPYALLCSAVALAMFTMHGAVYLCLKATGDGDGGYRARLQGCLTRAWVAFVLLLVAALTLTFFAAPHLFAGVLHRGCFWLALGAVLAGTVWVPVAAKAQRFRQAFAASAAVIVGVLLLGGTCLFPRLVPSLTDPANSLTIYNAAASPLSLRTILIIAALGLPAVVCYTVFIYRVFQGRPHSAEDGY